MLKPIWCHGYGAPGGGDPNVRATLLRHGNWDSVTNATVWDPDIPDRALPASLYLGGKPAWWGDLPWPAIGPDLSPMIGKIPAQARYEAALSPQPTAQPTRTTPTSIPTDPTGEPSGTPTGVATSTKVPTWAAMMLVASASR